MYVALTLAQSHLNVVHGHLDFKQPLLLSKYELDPQGYLSQIRKLVQLHREQSGREEWYVQLKGSREERPYVLDAVTSSGILKAKQKLGRTFDSDKLGGIAFTKISKLTMCSAYEEAQAIVPASIGQHRHCTCSVLKFL